MKPQRKNWQTTIAGTLLAGLALILAPLVPLLRSPIEEAPQRRWA